MKQVECLHIPELREGETAEITWGAAETDLCYVIERNFDEPLTAQSMQYTWEDWDNCGLSWSQYDKEQQSWEQLENRTGKGRDFERLEYAGLDWTQIEGRSLTWQEFENLTPSFEIYRGPGIERNDFHSGRTWLEMDAQEQTWSEMDVSDYSWEEGETVTLPGLSWDAIDARWQTFDEWEQHGLPFQESGELQHAQQHRGMTDTIPIGVSSAVYRIKIYDLSGAESGYLTTDQVPVIPIFYRSGTVEYPVTKGNHYRFMLTASEVYDLDKIRMNLYYDQSLLEMTSFAAGTLQNITEPGKYLAEEIHIYSHSPGNIWFQSVKTLEPDTCFDGALTLMEFAAKGTGAAAISLS